MFIAIHFSSPLLSSLELCVVLVEQTKEHQLVHWNSAVQLRRRPCSSIKLMPFLSSSEGANTAYKSHAKKCMFLFALARISSTTNSFVPVALQSRKLNLPNIASYSKVNRIRNFATMNAAEINTKAKFVSTSPQAIEEAGARLRSGHLVSFPTETVYGLGCHAIDPVAVSRVFEAKERPLTDPLIVHVNECEAALKLWNASANGSDGEIEQEALNALTKEFWPGPLTIVAKASPEIPDIIMANTGFVACRSPSHPIARALIGASGVPIAAPSANKFGHVSPTKAQHVMDDLCMEDVWIVDPDMEKESSSEEHVICDVGVESTVAKVEMLSTSKGRVSILRHGAVSSMEIATCLEKAGLSESFEVKEKMQATGEEVSHVAPGQTIRHYSPNVLSYMVSQERYSNGDIELSDEEFNLLKNSVVIDFGKRLSSFKDKALAYKDLSAVGDSNVAAAQVFDTLRWSENIDGAERVFIPQIVVNEDHMIKKEDALILAVKDRLTRAASGVVIETLQ